MTDDSIEVLAVRIIGLETEKFDMNFPWRKSMIADIERGISWGADISSFYRYKPRHLIVLGKRDYRVGYISDGGETFGNDFGLDVFGFGTMGTPKGGSPEELIAKNINPSYRELPSLSRDHCLISFLNDQRFVSDLGSRTGTFLNRVKLAPESHRKLNPRDTIGLIPYEGLFLLTLKYYRL